MAKVVPPASRELVQRAAHLRAARVSPEMTADPLFQGAIIVGVGGHRPLDPIPAVGAILLARDRRAHGTGGLLRGEKRILV
jgi:hypothetical protein